MPSPCKILTKEFIEQELLINKKTKKDFCKKFKCSVVTLTKYCKKFNITIPGKYDAILTKEFLTQKYIKENLLIVDISKLTKIPAWAINKKLKKFGIKIINKRRFNLIGEKRGCLYVKEEVSKTKTGQPIYKCVCDCGKEVEYLAMTVDKFKDKFCKICRKGKNSKFYKGVGDISASCWCKIKERANHPFEITIEYAWDLFVKQDGKCALTGIKLKFSENAKNHSERTASLDRIDSNGIYSVGNVQWVHKDVNFMKQNFLQDYYIEICKMVAEKFKNKEKYNIEDHKSNIMNLRNNSHKKRKRDI